MQLTDAEIREILRRRKIEKMRRQRRRRRIALLILIFIIIAVLVFFKVLGNPDGEKKSSDSGKAAYNGEERGIIFIDPGHGGMDPGSDNDNGKDEKEDTLRLSLAVRDYLEAAGFKVVMSRTEDETVDRTERGKMANKSGAQLFVSIHRNKAANDGHGVEGFIPKDDNAESRLLGENIMHALGRMGFTERTIRAGTLNDPNDDYKENAATEMPSVLIEVGFMSHAGDNALFDNNLEHNAKAIAGAIDYTFLQIYDPERAAEYAARMKVSEETADKAAANVKQAVEAAAEATHVEPEPEDGDESTGIDPEAEN